MGLLLVKRKGYTAKRGDTTYRVSPTTFKIKDRGEPGRTPKSKRWFEPGKPLGWRHTDPQEKRRRIALRSRGGNLLKTAKALLALANVQKRINPEVSRKARADAEYFFNLHKKRKK